MVRADPPPGSIFFLEAVPRRSRHPFSKQERAREKISPLLANRGRLGFQILTELKFREFPPVKPLFFALFSASFGQFRDLAAGPPVCCYSSLPRRPKNAVFRTFPGFWRFFGFFVILLTFRPLRRPPITSPKTAQTRPKSTLPGP